MTSGAKVVIAMFAATGAIAVFVVVAFLLTNEPAVRCVEGELQDNAVRADGAVLPRVETFATLEEAESFICRHIPHPRDTGDLTLSKVRVARELNLGKTIEGEGGASIEFEYSLDGEPKVRLEVAFPPREDFDAEGPPAEEITIRGERATLQQADSGTHVFWTKGGFSYFATSTPGYSTTSLLAILESVR